MAKKKTKISSKKVVKTSAKSSDSHGQLFDSHPNLIWLLPIFLIFAAVAVLMYYNSVNPVKTDNMINPDQIPQEIKSVISPTEAMEAPSGY